MGRINKNKRFVKERHKAFADVLYYDDFTALKEYSEKYKVPYPKSERIAKAGVYKAIVHCTDFTAEEKELAKDKCLALGFSYDIKY